MSLQYSDVRIPPVDDVFIIIWLNFTVDVVSTWELGDKGSSDSPVPTKDESVWEI